MADEPTGPTVTEQAFMFLGALALLVALWYFSGGPSRSDLRGIFLAPPPPLDTGGAYGPEFFEAPTTFSTSTP